MRVFLCAALMLSPSLAQTAFRYAIPGDVWTLDPHLENHVLAMRIQAQIFESPLEVVENEAGFADLAPAVCSVPEVSEDRLSVILRVQDGVRFHDDGCFPDGKGRQVTGDDLRFLFMRHADPQVPSRYYEAFVRGRIVGLDAWREQAIHEDVTDYDAPVSGLVVDGNSLTIKLTAPYPQLVPLLSQPWASVVPRDALRRYGNGFGDRPVGTGPFRFSKKDVLKTVTLVRNPDYRIAGLPKLDEVRFEVVADLDDQVKRFEAGESAVLEIFGERRDRFLHPRSGSILAVQAKKGFQLAEGREFGLSYFCFNAKNTILAKREVRQAMCLALDRSTLAKALFGPRVTVADLPFPQSFPEAAAFKRDPWAFGKRNLKKAQELLTKAGYEGGKGLPEFVFDYIGAGPKDREVWKLIQGQLAAVGIRAQMREPTFEVFLDRVRKGDMQMAFLGWFADYPDVENFLLLFRSSEDPVASSNFGSYGRPEVDTLYDEIAALDHSNPLRKTKVEKLVKLLREDCPWIPLAEQRVDFVVAKGVTDFHYSVLNHSLKRVGMGTR